MRGARVTGAICAVLLAGMAIVGCSHDDAPSTTSVSPSGSASSSTGDQVEAKGTTSDRTLTYSLTMSGTPHSLEISVHGSSIAAVVDGQVSYTELDENQIVTCKDPTSACTVEVLTNTTANHLFNTINVFLTPTDPGVEYSHYKDNPVSGQEVVAGVASSCREEGSATSTHFRWCVSDRFGFLTLSEDSLPNRTPSLTRHLVSITNVADQAAFDRARRTIDASAQSSAQPTS